MAKCNAKFCELTDAKFGVGDNFWAHGCAMVRESRRIFRTKLWLDTLRCIELFGQESVGRTDEFCV